MTESDMFEKIRRYIERTERSGHGDVKRDYTRDLKDILSDKEMPDFYYALMSRIKKKNTK